MGAETVVLLFADIPCEISTPKGNWRLHCRFLLRKGQTGCRIGRQRPRDPGADATGLCPYRGIDTDESDGIPGDKLGRGQKLSRRL